MLYNDFQILDDDKYALISQQFKNSNPRTQSEIVDNLFLNLNCCKNHCLGLNTNVNKRIQAVLVRAKDVCDNIIGSINTLYKIKTTAIQTVTNFNLFSFAKKLIETIELIDELITDTNNPANLKNFSKAIIGVAEDLFDALEKSNIHLFKHM